MEMERVRPGHATNLLFKKVISWQIIGLENHVWYGPEDAETTTHSRKFHGRFLEKTKPAQLSTCCCVNSCKLIYEVQDPQTVADLNKTILPVGTTRDWTEQLDDNKDQKSQQETLATKVNALSHDHY